MSTITYNGIALKLVRTRRCDRIDVYSDDGSKSYLYTRWDIEVETYYNPRATNYAGQLPAVTDVAIRQTLRQPRGVFEWRIGNAVWIRSPAIDPLTGVGFATDACNGPEPISCNVVQISGMKSFLVTFRIALCTVECAAARALLSNRFTEEHDVDDQFYTTRIIRGRARFRSDVLIRGDIASDAEIREVADHFREYVIPKIPLGFKRERVHVVTTPDMTELQYTIIDREFDQGLGLDCPAVKFEGYSTVAVGVPDGGGPPTNVQTVTIKAYGQKGTSRNDLMFWALRVALAELDAGGKGIMVRQAAMTKALHAKYAELTVTALLVPPEQGATMRTAPASPAGGQPQNSVLVLGFQRLAHEDLPKDAAGKRLLPKNEDKSPIPPNDGATRGSWNGVMLRQALELACTEVPRPQNTIEMRTRKKLSFMRGKPIVVVEEKEKLPEEKTPFKSEAFQSLFTSYTIKTKQEKQQNVLRIPVASAALDTAAVVIRLAAPTSWKKIWFTAEAIGGWPKVPSPVTGDPNDVLVKDVVRPQAPFLTPDGLLCYAIKGFYHFVQKVAKGAGDELTVGAIPYQQADLKATKLPASSFVDDILSIGKVTTNVLGAKGGTSELKTKIPKS